jgi:hypothetical protein
VSVRDDEEVSRGEWWQLSHGSLRTKVGSVWAQCAKGVCLCRRGGRQVVQKERR